MINVNLNDFKVSSDELEDLGLNNNISIPSIQDDIDALEGASDFEGYISIDSDSGFTPGFEESGFFDSEDYDTNILD